MNISGNLATEERLDWMKRRLDADGRVSIGAAAAELGVSDMTIRRTLQELEAQGLARRVRGGAVAVGPAAFATRHRQGARAKTLIAAKLLGLVHTSDAIGLDASSTMLRLATSLTNTRDLTVVTDGLETFQALQGAPGVSAQLTGGKLHPRTGSLVGPLACRGAGSLILTRLFVSAAGVDPVHGASETELDEAEVKRAFAAVSQEIVLGVAASKLGSPAVARSLDWEGVDILVTELDPADRRLDPYRHRAKIL